MNRYVWNTGGFLLLNYRGREKNAIHEGWEHIEIVLPGEPETNARAWRCCRDEGLVSRG